MQEKDLHFILKEDMSDEDIEKIMRDLNQEFSHKKSIADYQNQLQRVYFEQNMYLNQYNVVQENVPLCHDVDDVPSRLHKYMVQGVNGRWSFNQEIKDIILFEYHDCTNENPYPEMDLVFIRDVLSYLNPQKQKILVDEIVEKLKTDGILVVGSNETVVKDGLSNISKGRVSAFKKE